MATYSNMSTPLVHPTNPFSDAAFRSLVTQLHTALLAGGWAQAADTGQLDPATVAAPTSIGAFAPSGLIYYMNDSLHSTFPLYMRLTVGVGQLYQFKWSIQFAYATTGTGSLTGWVSAVYPLDSGTAGSLTVPGVCLASGGLGSNYLSYGLTGSSGASRPFFVVCRSFNPSTGALLPNGNWSLLYGTGTPAMVATERVSSTTIVVGSNCTFPVGPRSGSTGGDAEVYRLYTRTQKPAVFGGAGCYYLTEITANTTFTLDLYGSTRTWYATGKDTLGGAAGYGLAVLWE